MSGTKISELPVATLPLTGAETVPVVQSGATKQTTLANMPYVPSGTGAVTTTVQAKLRETVSVKDFGAVGDGVTDDSAAVLNAFNAAYAAGRKRLYFPTGNYKFSIQIIATKELLIYGDGNGSTFLIPKDATNPCFIIKGDFNTWPVGFRAAKFLDLAFKDYGTQLSCGVWTEKAVSFERCDFVNLKYGVIANTAEWSIYKDLGFIACYVGVYATSALAANDPIGIGQSYIPGTNPSEQYFTDCWFSSGSIAYFEEQPDNTLDKTTAVYFNRCQFMQKYGVATIGSNLWHSGIVLTECWTEGRTGSEPDIVIRGNTIKSSVVYSEGTNVYIENCVGFLDTNNPIYVKQAAGASFMAAPRLTIKNTNAVNGKNVVLDAGVISSLEDCSVYTNGGTALTEFTKVKNVRPYRTDAGCIFPSPIYPIRRIGSAGSIVNVWNKGTCTNLALDMFGATASIISGDGFIDNSGYKFCRVVAPNTNGLQLGSITMPANGTLIISFAMRQNTGSNASFKFLTGGIAQVSGGFVVPGDNVWRFYTAITNTATAQTGCFFRLLNYTGVSVTFDMSACQAVVFNDFDSAAKFIDSGLYVDPVTL